MEKSKLQVWVKNCSPPTRGNAVRRETGVTCAKYDKASIPLIKLLGIKKLLCFLGQGVGELSN